MIEVNETRCASRDEIFTVLNRVIKDYTLVERAEVNAVMDALKTTLFKVRFSIGEIMSLEDEENIGYMPLNLL
jgi:hypothetical protein